ncbi:hypothetical protein DPMN_158730 [Dreissena polymorpha]|uniref:Uncharacterized protein n=1 Tax=Dreissena polymorpha TaxID=45954 RepID=A0A9D4ING9_DREPO|nr:hypothetical protein DPMN_158730 [Dreissena polymorpha]
MDELYCLSSGVPAEPKAAANILKAVDIGCAAMEAFITSFTGCDTVSAFVRRGKVGPAKLLEKNTDLMLSYAKFGERQECSDDLLVEIEYFRHFPTELVDILCTKLQEDKTNQDEDENDDSIEIDNSLNEVFDDQ